MKKALIFFLFLTILSPLRNLHGSDGDKITLKIGVYNNPPKISVSENGTASGYHIDIIEALFTNTDYIIEYHTGTWDECLERLKSGKIDIMPDVAWSPEREEIFDFNNEYVLLNWAMVYSSKNNYINIIPDLNGKKIAVMKDSIHTEGEFGIINQVKNYGINCDFIYVNNYKDAFDKINKGIADAAVVNRLYGLMNEKKNNVKRTPIIFNPTQIKYALKKNNSINKNLIKLIDLRIKHFKKDNTSAYNEAFKKYLLPEIKKEKIVSKWTVKIILLGIFISIIISFYLLSSRSGRNERTLLKKFFRENRSMLDIRSNITDHSLTAYALFSIPLFLSILYHEISFDWNNIIWFYIPVTLVPVIAALFKKYLSNIFKIFILILCMFVTGLLVLKSWGRIGTGFTFFLTAGTLITLLYGKRTGLAIITTGLLITVIFGVLIQYKILFYNYNMIVYSQSPSSWIFAIMALFVMFFTIISGVEKFYANLISAVDNLEQVVRERSIELVKANEELILRIENQEKAEKAVYESEKKYRDLVESANSIILRWKPDGTITFINTYGQKFFGYNEPEIIGKKIIGTIAPQTEMNGKDISNMIDDISKNPEAYIFNENENIKKDGERVWIAWTNKPIFIDEDIISEILSVGNDISERKAMEKSLVKTLDELAIAKERAESADRTKSSFLASMSHEIRTPLNAILGYTQILLKEKSLMPEVIREIEIINSSGEHLLDLINEILDMSKIEAGKTEIINETFSLYSVIKQIENLFVQKTKRKGIGLKVNISDFVPDLIITDKAKIKQIIINLIGNAVKFTDDGFVSVDVSLSKSTPGFISFSVIDTGKGISNEHLENIFSPFEQTKDGRERGGTGLGLSISSKYAILLGGDITVSSEPGKGSCFTFNMPYLKSNDETISDDEAGRNIIGIKKNPELKVLIVDDREVNRDILVRMLDPLGFILKEASGGNEAIRLLHTWKPDLVLLDLIMPDLDGRDVIKMIKDTMFNADIKIIVITASVLDISKEQIFELGADAFIRKPFRENSVFNEIRDAFGLEFVYDEKKEDNTADTLFIPRQELVKMFQQIPSEICIFLKNALMTGDIENIKKSIEKISIFDIELARNVKYMTDDFEFNSLLELLDDYN